MFFGGELFLAFSSLFVVVADIGFLQFLFTIGFIPALGMLLNNIAAGFTVGVLEVAIQDAATMLEIRKYTLAAVATDNPKLLVGLQLICFKNDIVD